MVCQLGAPQEREPVFDRKEARIEQPVSGSPIDRPFRLLMMCCSKEHLTMRGALEHPVAWEVVVFHQSAVELFPPVSPPFSPVGFPLLQDLSIYIPSTDLFFTYNRF